MRTQAEVLGQFDEWARGNDIVRAAILTSTRDNPERETDFLSDYDIEFFVADLNPFQKDDSSLKRMNLRRTVQKRTPRGEHPEIDVYPENKLGLG